MSFLLGGHVAKAVPSRRRTEGNHLPAKWRECGAFLQRPPENLQGAVPDIRFERMTSRLQGGCSTPELIRRSAGILQAAYLTRVSRGLPPVGFFGSEGAGSAVTGFAGSPSALAWTAGLTGSMSNVMPWPVSRAYSACTAVIGTAIWRATPPKRAENSISSLPICSLCTAVGEMLSVISPAFTYSDGTCTPESTFTARCGV